MAEWLNYNDTFDYSGYPTISAYGSADGSKKANNKARQTKIIALCTIMTLLWSKLFK